MNRLLIAMLLVFYFVVQAGADFCPDENPPNKLCGKKLVDYMQVFCKCMCPHSGCGSKLRDEDEEVVTACCKKFKPDICKGRVMQHMTNHCPP
uniref:Uncharacterized protein n=1 Tax=Acrobeloides nanus TaxID=290746 RepID=A0A914DTG2_9BILA